MKVDEFNRHLNKTAPAVFDFKMQLLKPVI